MKQKWLMLLIMALFLIAGGAGGYCYFNGKGIPELIQDVSGILPGKEIPSEIPVSTAYYDSEGKLTASKIYTYSKNGLHAECIHTRFDPMTSENTWRRNISYELTKPYILSEIKSSQTFDESGNMTEEEIHENGGKKVTNRIYADGITTETIHYYDEKK